MRRVIKWLAITAGGLVGLLALGLGAWHLLDQTPAPANAVSPAGSFDASRLLVLADADMAATAYADGVLYPIDASDQLIALSNLDEQVERSSVNVPNTVMGWPGSLAVSEGRFAYVVSSRGSPLPSVTELGQGVSVGMPVSRTLTTVDLGGGAPETISEMDVCLKPLSTDVAPSGDWLLIACGDAANELSVVTLQGGRPDEVRAFDLDVPIYNLRETDAGASYAAVHPGGEAAGVVLENHALTLVRFDMDEGGVPVSATAESPLELDRWLSVARWTWRGDHLLVADVGWGPRATDAVTNGPGAVLSFALAPDGDERGLVSEAVVSKSPEAFELNRDGTLLAAVNMERTYLPGGFPLGLVPGRGASSLSLVGVNDATGELTTYGEPVGFRGVLPEDAVWDTDGDQLAVVVYQDHDAPRSGGWVRFFNVNSAGEVPQFQLTDRSISLPRGTHDLYVLD